MIRSGKVVKAAGKLLHVCFERPEMCQHCGACGHKQESLVTLYGDARVGDTVIVDMPEGQLLRLSLITYLIPLAGLILGMLLGSRLFASEQMTALLGGVALVLCLVPVVLYDRHCRKTGKRTPTIIDVIKNEEEQKNV